MSSKMIIPYLLEAFIMIYIGIGLFNHKVSKKRIAYTVMIYTASIFLVRVCYERFQLPLGSHSILLLILFCIYCRMICRFTVIQAIATAYIDFTLIMIGEWMVLLPILEALDVEFNSAFYNTWEGTLICLTGNTLLVITGIICFLKGYVRTRQRIN